MPLNHTSQYAELTDAQYRAIGKAVVEWANIEYLLGVLLGRLLSTPEFLARTYTDSMSAARIQGAIQEAVEIHQSRYGYKLVPERVVCEIAEINSKVTSLRATRNKIAHFCWCRSSDDAMFGTNFAGGIPTPKKEKRDSALLPMSELAELHRQAFDLVERLGAIVSNLPRIEEETILTLRSTGLAASGASHRSLPSG